jgi:citrate lyase subunit beta / citryl-CoA lyase
LITSGQMLLTRSLMFVPGSKQRMIDKSLGMTNLDVAMYDIEDGVSPQEKPLARTLVAEMLSRARQPHSPSRFVRINGVGSGKDRIDADLDLIRPGLDGLVVPKVDTTDQLRWIAEEVDRREKAHGMTAGSVRIIAAIESARGLLNAPQIATTSPRVLGLLFGAEDYALDLRLPSNREGEARELLFARSWFANAAASGNVEALDGVWPDISDTEGVRRDAVQARRLGMTGKSLFHPSQIDVINESFVPTEAELEYARRVVQAFDEAQRRGDGAVAFGGQLLDRPIVERARRTLVVRETLSRRLEGA